MANDAASVLFCEAGATRHFPSKPAMRKHLLGLTDPYNACFHAARQHRCYGSINFPAVALMTASVRVAAPSLARALSV